MSVVVVGLNHRTVPLPTLERMAVSDAALPKALHDLTGRAHIDEAVVLSTCMRTEVYVDTDRFHGALGDVRAFLAEWPGLAPESFSAHLYDYFGESAASHLFEVASGLDSAVIGEGEILTQVRRAWERCHTAGAVGPALAELFRHAVEVGKRARSETAIARGTTSISQAAVAMATEHVGGLGGRSILVVGAGDMGAGMAATLSSAGVAAVLVANRTRSRAVGLARRIGGEPIAMADIAAALASVDVVLTSTGAPEVLLTRDDVAAAMAGRPDRALLIVDMAVPRDVDPGVSALDGVSLLDMDDLRSFAEAGLAGRRGEVERVQAIVSDEVDRHGDRVTARRAAPLVADLRTRAEEIRQAELARYRSRLASLDERQAEAVEALTKAVVAKLLHPPTVALRAAAGTPRGERLVEALRAAFDLEA